MGRKPKDQNGQLTEFELEVMTYLWDKNGATASEVHEYLTQEKDYAYTTVSTVLRVLEKKSIVETEKLGRQHRYIPLISKSSHQSQTLNHLVNRVFDGTPMALVHKLVEDQKMSPSDLNELKRILQDMES